MQGSARRHCRTAGTDRAVMDGRTGEPLDRVVQVLCESMVVVDTGSGWAR